MYFNVAYLDTCKKCKNTWCKHCWEPGQQLPRSLREIGHLGHLFANHTRFACQNVSCPHAYYLWIRFLHTPNICPLMSSHSKPIWSQIICFMCASMCLYFVLSNIWLVSICVSIYIYTFAYMSTSRLICVSINIFTDIWYIYIYVSIYIFRCHYPPRQEAHRSLHAFLTLAMKASLNPVTDEPSHFSKNRLLSIFTDLNLNCTMVHATASARVNEGPWPWSWPWPDSTMIHW